MLILGVSFDSVEKNRAFAEKEGFPYPLLCDTTRKMGLAYGATQAGEKGGAKRIAYLIGPDGRVAQAFPKVDARAFPQKLLDTL